MPKDNFIKGEYYKFFAHGFPEPIEGEVLDIEISEGNVVLVIKTNDPDPVFILVDAITGVQHLPKNPTNNRTRAA